jgi:chromosome segregation and condensation protein ScpB
MNVVEKGARREPMGSGGIWVTPREFARRFGLNEHTLANQRS